MNYDFNVLQLIPLVDSHKRCIVGVDGLSRSGKTTFTEKLSDYLKKEDIKYVIFHIDDHIVNRSQRYNTGFEEWYEYFYLQWDVAWLKEHFFENLKRSSHIDMSFYNKETDTHEHKTIILPKAGLIVVEGVFLQRKEWRNFFDKILFLDCSRERRFARETETTQRSRMKFETRYWKAEEYYINTFSPLQGADLVLRT
ncbi:kinase [Bacillus sp. 165]|uniref:kinase n=1 Tax=Bacillus sp. 165 TaxID=1529117 RepID=UPI001FFDFEC8|nr:kinase [Bacillus sp. 165]